MASASKHPVALALLLFAFFASLAATHANADDAEAFVMKRGGKGGGGKGNGHGAGKGNAHPVGAPHFGAVKGPHPEGAPRPSSSHDGKRNPRGLLGGLSGKGPGGSRGVPPSNKGVPRSSGDAGRGAAKAPHPAQAPRSSARSPHGAPSPKASPKSPKGGKR